MNAHMASVGSSDPAHAEQARIEELETAGPDQSRITDVLALLAKDGSMSGSDKSVNR